LPGIKTDYGLEDDYSTIDDVDIKLPEETEETEETGIKAEFDYAEEDDDEEDLGKGKKRKVKKRARKVKEEIKHSYIPKHEIVPSEELDKLISEQNLNPEKLPLIFIADPGIAHLEVKVGDVIKITRKNRTVGDVVYYRKVVSI
jgi:DNA-directed RNA polymerase subunit H